MEPVWSCHKAVQQAALKLLAQGTDSAGAGQQLLSSALGREPPSELPQFRHGMP